MLKTNRKDVLRAYDLLNDKRHYGSIDELELEPVDDPMTFVPRGKPKNPSIKSTRAHTRYLRADLQASLKASRFMTRYSPVELLNVSEQGAAIMTHRTLRQNKTVLSKLCFPGDVEFEFKGQVVQRFKGKQCPYGILFLERNRAFKEILVKTELEKKMLLMNAGV